MGDSGRKGGGGWIQVEREVLGSGEGRKVGV